MMTHLVHDLKDMPSSEVDVIVKDDASPGVPIWAGPAWDGVVERLHTGVPHIRQELDTVMPFPVDWGEEGADVDVGWWDADVK